MSSDPPRPHFKFAVLIGGDGPSRALRARFREVTGLKWQPEPRMAPGASPPPPPRKIAGPANVPEIVLRRGEVVDGGGLYLWLEGTRRRGPDAVRTITIQLLDAEDPRRPLQQWKLSSTRVVRYAGPELNAKSGDVAVEELVLASDRLDFG